VVANGYESQTMSGVSVSALSTTVVDFYLHFAMFPPIGESENSKNEQNE